MTEIRLYSARGYDQPGFEAANRRGYHAITFLDTRLDMSTVGLAAGAPAVCAFVNDDLSAPVLAELAAGGTTCVAMRCAGYNNVDLEAAYERGISVARVPAYSPYAVAEHAVALMAILNRRIHRAHNRIREGNFSLTGLVGFDMHSRTAGLSLCRFQHAAQHLLGGLANIGGRGTDLDAAGRPSRAGQNLGLHR